MPHLVEESDLVAEQRVLLNPILLALEYYTEITQAEDVFNSEDSIGVMQQYLDHFKSYNIQA